MFNMEIPMENDNPLARDGNSSATESAASINADAMASRRIKEARIENLDAEIEKFREKTVSDPTGRNLYRVADEAAQAQIQEDEVQLAKIRKNLSDQNFT